MLQNSLITQAVAQPRDTSVFTARHLRQRIALLLCVVLFFLSGCAGLPTSGDVQIVQRAQQREGGVVLDPKGPAAGASAEQIIAGFLRAASVGLTDDFKAARQFLTKEMAAKWNPLTAVRVYPDTQAYSSSQTPSGAFRITVPALGSLDSDGIYTAASVDSQIAVEFSLVRNPDGEWRIAVLDDGVMMSRSLFSSLYLQAPLYFPSISGKSFVADMRWYPQQGIVAAIARGLVKGPAKWLAPAVRPVISPEVTLVGAQIRANDATAVIDFSVGATALPPESISLLHAQYRQSLLAAGVAKDVILTVAGVQISSENPKELPVYPLPDPPLIALHEEALVQVLPKNNELAQLLPREKTKDLSLTDLTLGYGQEVKYAAALGESGTKLYQIDFPQKNLQVLLEDAALLPPSIDAFGWIWSGARLSQGELAVINSSSGERINLKIPELTGVELQFVKVSREGARLVLVYEDLGKPVLAVVAVKRDAQGKPEQLGELMRFGQRLGEVHDLAWFDETHLVILGRAEFDATASLLKMQIGGLTESLNMLNEIVGLTAAHGKDSIVLVDRAGLAYEYTSGAWRKFAAGLAWPAMSG